MDVQTTVAETLQQLVRPGDHEAVAAIAVQLEGDQVGGRRAATQLLKALKEQGSVAASTALAKHAKQSSAIARASSVFGAFSEHQRKRGVMGGAGVAAAAGAA